MHDTIGQLLVEWQASRIVLAELEAAEHPNITDHHRRVWKWWKGDLYRHDTLAWPEVFVRDTRHGLPTQAARENPNERLCSICRGE